MSALIYTLAMTAAYFWVNTDVAYLTCIGVKIIVKSFSNLWCLCFEMHSLQIRPSCQQVLRGFIFLKVILTNVLIFFDLQNAGPGSLCDKERKDMTDSRRLRQKIMEIIGLSKYFIADLN